MIVGKSGVLAIVFEIEGTVALALIGITAGTAVKNIAMMHPDMLAAFDGDAVFLKIHQPQIADFHTAAPV